MHSCTSNFHTTSDRDSLARITSLLTSLRTTRHDRLSQQQQSVKKLQRRQLALEQQRELDMDHAGLTQHASEIVRLDGVKFKIAKEASDAEIESGRLEGECRRAEGALGDLDAGGDDGGAAMGRGRGAKGADDRDVLKLKLYRSLGIDMEPDKEGAWTRAVVRNAHCGVVDVVDLTSATDGAASTERIWGCL